MSEATADLSFDEWLAGEARSEVRHEYVGGRAYAMAGGTERHDLTAAPGPPRPAPIDVSEHSLIG